MKEAAALIYFKAWERRFLIGINQEPTWKRKEYGRFSKIVEEGSTKTIRHLYKNKADCKSALPAESQLGLLKEGKSFWQREYWDRFIRDERHYYTAIDYIHNNPVKASLVKNAVD